MRRTTSFLLRTCCAHIAWCARGYVLDACSLERHTAATLKPVRAWAVGPDDRHDAAYERVDSRKFAVNENRR